MTFSVHNRIITPLFSKADDLYQLSDPKSKDPQVVFNRTLGCRLVYLTAAILSPIVSPIDLVAGSIIGTASILTGGYFKPLNQFSSRLLTSGSPFLGELFGGVVKAINPDANMKHQLRIPSFAEYVLPKIRSAAASLTSCPAKAEKHVASVLVYLGYIGAAIATRVADLVIGIFAAFAAIAALGTIPELNAKAIRSLYSAPQLLCDIHFGITKMINPRAVF